MSIDCYSRSILAAVLGAACVALMVSAAPASADEPAADRPTLELEQSLIWSDGPPAASAKSVVPCRSLPPGSCRGTVSELLGADLAFSDGNVWFVARPTLKDAMTAVGCTSNFYLRVDVVDNGSPADRWLTQIALAEAYDQEITLVFGQMPTDGTLCRIRWVYRHH